MYGQIQVKSPPQILARPYTYLHPLLFLVQVCHLRDHPLHSRLPTSILSCSLSNLATCAIIPSTAPCCSAWRLMHFSYPAGSDSAEGVVPPAAVTKVAEAVGELFPLPPSVREAAGELPREKLPSARLLRGLSSTTAPGAVSERTSLNLLLK